VVDHHATNTRFGTHHLVDAEAPATVVLVEELLRRLGAKMTPEIATALYTGLITDTRSFRHRTTASTHVMAERLLAAGARHDVICRQIGDTVKFGYLKVLARALAAASLEPAAAGGLGAVWTVVPRALRAEHSLTLHEIDDVIDVLRTTAEAEVAFVLKEEDNGGRHVSVRSKGRVDVGRVCAALGGGGHRPMAGFRTSEDASTTVSRLLGLLANVRVGA